MTCIPCMVFCSGMKREALLQLSHKRSAYFVYMFILLKVLFDSKMVSVEE